MDIHERLAEFLRRLHSAPAVGTSKEAFALICQLIEQVEDELCPLPRQNPPPAVFTGRMYAPLEDNVERFTNGLIVADTRHHRIYCRPDGGISIIHVPSRSPVLYKEGKHERTD